MRKRHEKVVTPEGIGFDIFVIDHTSAFAREMLTHEPGTSWSIYVKGSGGNPSSWGHSFGFLRVNTARTAVYMILLPYGINRLSELYGEKKEKEGVEVADFSFSPVDQWKHLPKQHSPPQSWLQQFHDFLNKEVPGYYGKVCFCVDRVPG